MIIKTFKNKNIFLGGEEKYQKQIYRDTIKRNYLEIINFLNNINIIAYEYYNKKEI
jgi:hypothetical protein